MASAGLAGRLMDARSLLSLEISEPRDTGVVAVVGGARLANVTTSTVLNLGFDRLDLRLLGPGGAEKLPSPAALEIDERWARARCRARLYAQGELVFDGRVIDCELAEFELDPVLGLVCAVSLGIDGLAKTELSGAVPDLPEDFTDEGNTVTQSELLRWLVEELAGQGFAIAAKFDRVIDTSVNIGPIDDSDQDTPLTLVQQSNRVGVSNDDEETSLLVYAGEDGPTLLQLCDCPTAVARWAISAAGSGLRRVRRGDEFATAIQALVTGEDGSEGLDPVSDADALRRVGGLARLRTVTLDRVGTDGGLAAIATTLALKANPVGWEGTYSPPAQAGRLVPYLRNAEGAEEPGWRARAGDVLRLLDGATDDPDYATHGREHAIVRSTEVDWQAGTVTLELDHRRIESRPGERTIAATSLRGEIEPGSSGSVYLSAASAVADTGIGSSPTLVDGIGDGGYVTFRAPKSKDYGVQIVTIWNNFTSTGRVAVGYDLDGEGVDLTNDVAQILRLNADASGGNPRTLSGTLKRRMKRGEHTLGIWAETSTGADLQYILVRIIG